MKTVDIVIVGAGVAGLFTALKLGNKYRIIVLEKAPFPHEKLCGGLMCEDAYTLIKPFNPPQSIFYTPVTFRIKVIDKDNKHSFIPPHTFHNLRRSTFYSWITSLLDENVSIVDKIKLKKIQSYTDYFILTVVDQEQRISEIRTKYLIGADGVNSFTRRCFFSERPVYIYSIQYTLKPVTSLNEPFFVFDQILSKEYYTWIIPRDDTIIIGTKIEGKNFMLLPERLRMEYNIQGEWLAKKAHAITKISNIDNLILGNGNLLLTGEAAGLVRPSSGEGLTLALQSAEYAAAAIQSAPHNPAIEYKQLCSLQFGLLNQDLRVVPILFNPAKRADYFSGTLSN